MSADLLDSGGPLLPTAVTRAIVLVIIIGGLSVFAWTVRHHAAQTRAVDAAYVAELRLTGTALAHSYSLHVTFGLPDDGARRPPVHIRRMNWRDAQYGEPSAVVTDVTRGVGPPGIPLSAVRSFDLLRAGASMDLTFTTRLNCLRPAGDGAMTGAPLGLEILLPSGRVRTINVPLRSFTASGDSATWSAALHAVSCVPGEMPGG